MAKILNLKGPAGSAGSDGSNGSDGAAGSQILTGAVDPIDADGANGDVYFQTGTGALGVAGDVWQKVAGSWGVA